MSSYRRQSLLNFFIASGIIEIVPSSKYIFNVQNLDYIRAGKYILRNIEWKMETNSNWVLFGPNGSGKTTLLQILTGYILPSNGHVEILGETVGQTNLPELRKRIGWVSNSLESLIHGEDPAIEIVVSGKFASTRLWERASENDFSRASTLLEDLGCSDIGEKAYGILSEGEKKKVLIARALMPDPDILILDEPCEGLDIASRERFLADLKRVIRAKRPDGRPYGIIFVTHHVDEIIDAFKRILILKNGNVVSRGSVDELINTKSISDVFEIPIEIAKKNGRYHSSLL